MFLTIFSQCDIHKISKNQFFSAAEQIAIKTGHEAYISGQIVGHAFFALNSRAIGNNYKLSIKYDKLYHSAEYNAWIQQYFAPHPELINLLFPKLMELRQTEHGKNMIRCLAQKKNTHLIWRI